MRFTGHLGKKAGVPFCLPDRYPENSSVWGKRGNDPRYKEVFEINNQDVLYLYYWKTEGWPSGLRRRS